MEKSRGRLTTGSHPGVIVDSQNFPSLESACNTFQVEKLLSYGKYSRQAPEFGIPPRPLPDGIEAAYFGVDPKFHSLVFLVGEDDQTTVEPAFALHACEKEAIDHQINSGVIAVSGKKFVAGPDDITKMVFGSVVHFGVPPLIREVALSDIGEFGLDERKTHLGLSFIHLLPQTEETEFILRSTSMTPSTSLSDQQLLMRKWDEEGMRLPDISPTKLAREVLAESVGATLLVWPQAFDIEKEHPVPAFDLTEVLKDTQTYWRRLKKAYPGREVSIVRNTGELTATYSKYFIHL